METNTENTQFNKVEEVKERKQKVSGSYTLRAFAENAKKLAELGFIEQKDLATVAEMHKKATKRFIEIELGGF